MAHAQANSIEEIELAMLQNDIANIEMHVLLPSNLVLDSPLDVPAKQARYIKQALPFLVEDQSSQDIEDLHIVLGDKIGPERYQVLLCELAQFAPLFDLLTQEGRACTLKAIYSEAQLLPIINEDLVVFCDAEGVALKHADGTGVSLSTGNLLSYVDTLLHRFDMEDEEDHVELNMKAYIPQDELDPYQMVMAQLGQYSHLHLNTETVFLTRFELLCQAYFQNEVNPVSLCQAPFEVKRKGAGQWSRWRAVAAVAGIWFLLQLGLFIGKGFYYEQQAQQFGSEALALYKKHFPNERSASVGNLNRIIQGKLNQNGAESSVDLDFLSTLGEAGYQYSKLADKDKMEFSSVSYNQQRGELVIEMKAGSFAQLDQLKNAIVAQGLTAKISSAVQENAYYRGRINVTGG